MKKPQRLIYLPLGGAGEIGMNCYVYGYGPAGKERLILVDLGVTFPSMDDAPGVDLITADTGWLERQADRIEAIFITHAHEDHIGALGLLWPRLRAKIYARRFTSVIARLKLEEAGLPLDALSVAKPWPARVKAGPFEVAFMPISHSVPESSALVIDTPAGRVLHSGDFKIDPTPVVGERWDEALIQSIIAEREVHALACDSTNIFSAHEGRSEASLYDPTYQLLCQAPGLVAATTFGSNIARLKTLAEAARAAGRSICVLGRAMRRMLAAAQEAGILGDFPPTISPEEAREMARGKLLLLTTGSQGERRAATAQLSRGKFLGLSLQEGDTFLFSSKIIPGNERAVHRIMNALSQKGVDVVDESGGLYHVSGHANRPDLEHFRNLVQPKILLPMHGEHRHLREHAKVACEAGIASAVIPNGSVAEISGAQPVVVDEVETGRLYLDGTALIGAMDGVIRERIRMALNGHALVTVLLDEGSRPMGDAWVELAGLPETGRSKRPLLEVLEEGLSAYIDAAPTKALRADDTLEEALRRLTRQRAQEEIGKRPEVSVVISRLQS